MNGKTRFIQLATTILFIGSFLLFKPVAVGANDDLAPINLSRSGAATTPVVLAEADGMLHIIWQDRFAGFVYTSGMGANWSEPTAVTFPFSDPPFSTPASDNFSATFTPRLLLDGQGIVHAFWQVDSALSYSNAPLVDISSNAAWSEPQILAASAPAYAVTVAEDGRLHLAYVRNAGTNEFPAGVYYRQRTQDGWSNARQLYQSNYLRAATLDQLHIDIVASGTDRIFVTWDNFLADKIFYVRSSDAGNSWPEPLALDRRGENDSVDTPGPHHLQLFTHENSVHLLWNRYSSTGRCEMTHLWAAGGGSSWQAREVLFDGTACPTRRHALVDETTNRLYLLTEQEQGSTVVRAWFETGWQSPQVRSGLLNFTNEETFRPVSLGCLRPVVAQGQLLIIGCGQSNVEDIWLVTGDPPDVSQLEDESEARWQLPASVARSTSEQFSPILLSREGGFIHLLWLERDTSLMAESETIVRYAYGDGTSWSRPAPVAEGHIDQMVAALTDDDRLLLVWRDMDEEILYFSQVEVARAAFPAQWSPPKEMVVNEPAVSYPSLLTTANNQIYLAYALTVNEGRGIYVRHSGDGGFNWSEPRLAFDAAAAGWPRIDTPSLAQPADGSLHLMWGRYPLLADNQPTAYYYALSLDQGETWSDTPTLVAEGSLGLGQVVTTPTGNDVLRLWQTKDEERSRLWYQHSENAGRTWGPPALLPALDELSGEITTLVDPVGRLHLLHMASSGQSSTRLNSWIWQTDSWQTVRADALFDLRPGGHGRHLSAIILDDGIFLLAFSGLGMSENVETETSHLFYTVRPITLPEERLPTAPAPLEPTPESTPLVEVGRLTDQEQPTPITTPDLSTLSDEPLAGTQFGPIDTTTSTGRILVGVLPASLVVIIGIAFGLYALRRREV